MIGKVLTQQSSEMGQKELQRRFFEETLDNLLPIYRQLLTVYFSQETH
ncbi:MAG: hypothetical protein JJU16_06420 [Alkalibacterium sp.]|nr:hypothetical protein [Alkalibacterium sp.]